jgi:8-oxo-dGTP diphosphatase
VADRAWRLAYWLGFRMALGWWRLRRPHHHGAMVAVWLDGLILGVRQSYTDRLTWPGGGIARGENPTHAAQRELHEELGLAVHARDLILVRRVTVECDHRQDHVVIFELHLAEPPVLTLDNREIVGAAFISPQEMLAAPTPPFVRDYLKDRAAP